ncbi:hypothetical protein GCM10011611_34310 [Aliidongia dinghuensis]|uniref:TIGR03118 family protein n=1 Tax=Aliidongia dinghuensis TaxID=1867774 RepID=A0A8J3E4A0_9PROT|nr:TIGR03118 family protein [Aliidongia dinghuensis]GGF25393.1 hypothetical protein GCM10011611_34310 [Aliidongia dinghuensis]
MAIPLLQHAPRWLTEATLALALLASSSGPAAAGVVVQTDIVSDGKPPAVVTDHNLLNAWGISYAPTGPFWISANGAGLALVFDGQGTKLLTVTIPAPPGATGASAPTGQVFNATQDFVVSAKDKSGMTHSAPAVFLFATEDGTISGWSPKVDPTNAVIAVNHSTLNPSAVYKGLTIFTDASGSYLLATNFRFGVVEVYDGHFHLVRTFRDHRLPSDFAPFNIQNLNGHLYVTYAKQDAERHDDVKGVGNGFVERVDIFGTIKASVHDRDDLNSPWGLAIAPRSFGRFAGKLLVGNFGDGAIHAFRPGNLHARGALKTDGAHEKRHDLKIDGLWALIVGNGGKGGDKDKVYFSAGPNGEADGLFGNLAFVHHEDDDQGENED